MSSEKHLDWCTCYLCRKRGGPLPVPSATDALSIFAVSSGPGSAPAHIAEVVRVTDDLREFNRDLRFHIDGFNDGIDAAISFFEGRPYPCMATAFYVGELRKLKKANDA